MFQRLKMIMEPQLYNRNDVCVCGGGVMTERIQNDTKDAVIKAKRGYARIFSTHRETDSILTF